MSKIKLCFALVLVSLLFVNCEPNDNNGSSQNDDTFAENFGATAFRDFIGQVVDVENHPLQNVEVKIGTSTVQTDVNGVFIINGAAVHEKFAFIIAKKTGYIDGSRSMVPTNGKNNVKIMLLPNTPLETIQSGETSEVSIYSGTKVVFDGAFQDENGAAYTGAVQVSMFHLTPSDENIDKLMPGMLYAQTQTNEEAVLETYGMLNVELRGTAGQKLNIASGHTAEITLRIDDSQIATAPTSIPLWHFDEAKGYWKEDGVATKVGNKYVGEVSHFSWWNCDASFRTVRLTITVVGDNGNTLSNVGVGLMVSGSNYPVMGVTNNDGLITGLIPANQTMTMIVYDVCGNVIHTATVGPFASDTILPNIVISASMGQSALIQGTLVKCDNTSNVTNGYVILNYGLGNRAVSVTNGAFSFSTMVCNGNNAFTLEGFDYDNLLTSGVINYTFTSQITNIGMLSTCDGINEFILYKVNDNPSRIFTTNITASTTSGGGPEVQLYISSESQSGNNLHFSIYGTTHIPGIYTGNEFAIYNNDFGNIAAGSSSLQFNLISFGAVGDYIDMTVNGTFISAGQTNHMSLTAHVIRDY